VLDRKRYRRTASSLVYRRRTLPSPCRHGAAAAPLPFLVQKKHLIKTPGRVPIILTASPSSLSPPLHLPAAQQARTVRVAKSAGKTKTQAMSLRPHFSKNRGGHCGPPRATLSGPALVTEKGERTGSSKWVPLSCRVTILAGFLAIPSASIPQACRLAGAVGCYQ